MTVGEPAAQPDSDRENVIDLGGTHVGDPPRSAAPREPAAAPREGLAARAARALSAWLLQIAHAWDSVRLPKLALPAPRSAPVTVGREPDCSLVLATDPTVSRRHADLCWIAGHWVLADLHSSNGTWVNGARIVSPTVVRAGDQVAFGRSRFVLSTDTRVARLFHAPGTTTSGHLRAVG